MKEITIKKYSIEDRNKVRDISYDTAFMGESAEIFFVDKEILTDFLTSYFTDYEPQSCFVAAHNKEVVGYILGTKNEKKMNIILIFKILPKLLLKALFKGAFFKMKNLFFLYNSFLSFMKDEFRTPRLLKYYPALLHINVIENYRSSGIGSRLINNYINYLKEEEIPGVHLNTFSERAASFYIKNGFKVLSVIKSSYYRKIISKDINYYCFGRKL